MKQAESKFTRVFDVERLGRERVKFTVEASADELLILARQLQIQSVTSFSAAGTLRRQDGSGQIELAGSVKAEVVQQCVASLVPVSQKIEEEFTVCYTFDRGEAALDEVEHSMSLEDKDLPELIVDNSIDVIHAVCEQVALAMDPYPRADNIDDVLMAGYLQEAQKDETIGGEMDTYRPFANLKDLLNKK